MLALYTYDISTALLILVLMLAVILDWRFNKIPNWLTLCLLGIGLALNYLLLPTSAVHFGLQGVGIGLLFLLPFYLTGGMGAGDVKLMAAIGSFIGPSAVLMAAAFSLVIGGCVAVYMILRSGELVSLYRRYLVMVTTRTLIPAEVGSVARRRFPFSLSIVLGTLIQLGLTGKLEFYHLTTQIGYQLQALGVMQ
ncbi:A24 family peptidase [Marinobacterium weihaiense]|nr:A24 family peptidase [Marinobacterium weihaiense]